MIHSVLATLAISTVTVFGAIATATEKNSQPKQFPQDLSPLVQILRKAGYQVYFAKPPISGAYGATNARTKKIWIAPISVDMGIARQTLIHEAVHAAQGCPNGRYEPIGWNVSLPKNIETTIKQILYQKYARKDYAVEKEAFYMQSHPQAFKKISEALKQAMLVIWGIRYTASEY